MRYNLERTESLTYPGIKVGDVREIDDRQMQYLGTFVSTKEHVEAWRKANGWEPSVLLSDNPMEGK